MNPSTTQTTVQEYASSQTEYKESPNEDQTRNGVVPLDSLPASWWNYLWSTVTKNNNAIYLSIADLRTELSNLIVGAGYTPSATVTNQVLTAIKKIHQTTPSVDASANPIPGSVISSAADWKVSVSTDGTMSVNTVIATTAKTGLVLSSTDANSVQVDSTGKMTVTALRDWTSTQTVKSYLDNTLGSGILTTVSNWRRVTVPFDPRELTTSITTPAMSVTLRGNWTRVEGSDSGVCTVAFRAVATTSQFADGTDSRSTLAEGSYVDIYIKFPVSQEDGSSILDMVAQGYGATWMGPAVFARAVVQDYPQYGYTDITIAWKAATEYMPSSVRCYAIANCEVLRQASASWASLDSMGYGAEAVAPITWCIPQSFLRADSLRWVSGIQLHPMAGYGGIGYGISYGLWSPWMGAPPTYSSGAITMQPGIIHTFYARLDSGDVAMELKMITVLQLLLECKTGDPNTVIQWDASDLYPAASGTPILYISGMFAQAGLKAGLVQYDAKIDGMYLNLKLDALLPSGVSVGDGDTFISALCVIDIEAS